MGRDDNENFISLKIAVVHFDKKILIKRLFFITLTKNFFFTDTKL